jgi:hypothetical protein
MHRGYKDLTNFLVGLGIEDVPHTEKSYLAHLIAVYRLLEAEGCDEELCRAGMFHSIYGTEQFQGFKLGLERRDEVRALIGERAERLGYLNCAMHRPAFDRAVAEGTEPHRYTDRITGEETTLTLRLWLPPRGVPADGAAAGRPGAGGVRPRVRAGAGRTGGGLITAGCRTPVSP